MLIIDDGSTDSSWEICKRLQDKDDRIKLVRQSNAGVSNARNKGMELAESKFIAFVDADDLVLNDYIRKLVDAYICNDVDFVCGSYETKKSMGRVKQTQYKGRVLRGEKLNNALVDVMRNIAAAPWGKLFSTEIIRMYGVKFPENIPYGEDAIFLFDYFKHINAMAIFPDVIYSYNYADVNSAARKYRSNVNEYLLKILEAKMSCFLFRGMEEELAQIRCEEETLFFEQCLTHYITREHNVCSLIEAIQRSADMFNITDEKGVYGKYVQENQWKLIIKKWKQNNLKDYVKSQIHYMITKLS